VDQDEVVRLVRAAADGDSDAWKGIVQRFSGMVWAITRGYCPNSADAADVFQTTWLRLVEHLDRIANPEHVGSWLATTARRESLRVARTSTRTFPAEADSLVSLGHVEHHSPEQAVLEAEQAMLDSERARQVWHAFRELPARCQQLLRVLMATPAAELRRGGGRAGHANRQHWAVARSLPSTVCVRCWHTMYQRRCYALLNVTSHQGRPHVPDQSDETELESELRQAVTQIDAIPSMLLEAAKDALTWRTIDADLAELVFDSRADDDEAALVRGSAQARMLSFRAGDLTIDIEVTGSGESRSLIGQIAHPRSGRAWISVRATARSPPKPTNWGASPPTGCGRPDQPALPGGSRRGQCCRRDGLGHDLNTGDVRLEHARRPVNAPR